jgi:hypothetical protein
VFTATHSTKETHNKIITKASATAEDKRKAGHVDRMIALNQSEDDKKDQIIKLNVIYERNEEDFSFIQVAVLQCLAIGKVYLDSFKEDKED